MFRNKETPSPAQSEVIKLPDFDRVFDLSKGFLPAVSGLRHSQEILEREKIRVDRRTSELFLLMFNDISQYHGQLQDKESTKVYEPNLVISTKTAKGQIQLNNYESRDRLPIVLLGEITEEPRDVSIKVTKKHTRDKDRVRIDQEPTTTVFTVEMEHKNGFLAVNLSKNKYEGFNTYTTQRSNDPEIGAILLNQMRPYSPDEKAEHIYIGAQILHLLSKIELQQSKG